MYSNDHLWALEWQWQQIGSTHSPQKRNSTNILFQIQDEAISFIYLVPMKKKTLIINYPGKLYETISEYHISHKYQIGTVPVVCLSAHL